MVLLRTNLFNNVTYQSLSYVSAHNAAVRKRYVQTGHAIQVIFCGFVTCFISIGLKGLREVLVVNSVAPLGGPPI